MPDTAISPREAALAPGRTRRAREDALLFERYRRTREARARDELVERFLPLAKRLARRYAESDEYDDLVQVASCALVKAVDRYDPGRGLAFSTYAMPTIVGELKHYFRDHCWTVRVPRRLHDHALQVQRAAERLTATPRAVAHGFRDRRGAGVQRRGGARGTPDRECPTSRSA